MPRRSRRKVVAEFEDCDYLVAPSGSCSGMIRTHYAELFADDPAMATRVEALAAQDPRAHAVPGRRAEARARARTLRRHRHLPRQLRGPARDGRQGVAARAARQGARAHAHRDGRMRDLLRLRRHVLDQVRRDLGAARRQQVRGTSRHDGADAVVLGDLGCMLNIEGRLRRRGDTKTKVLHVAEVLAGEGRPMEVASMHFKERAHVKLNDERLQFNLKKMQGKFVGQAARVAGRARRLRRHARRRQGDPQPRARRARRLARDRSSATPPRAARPSCGRRRRPTSTRWCSRSPRSTR